MYFKFSTFFSKSSVGSFGPAKVSDYGLHDFDLLT